MDPHDQVHVARFRKAHEWSRRQLAPFRSQRTSLIRLIAGSRYNEFNLPKSNPIPFLQLLHAVYVRSLVAAAPRCMCTTKVQKLKPLARAMEVAVDYEIELMDLAGTLRTVVADALCCMGIIKVGVCQYPIEGTTGPVRRQQSYADHVSLDDWVQDMRAKKPDQFGFCGHKFRVPREALLNDPRYDPNKVRAVGASSWSSTDEIGQERTEALSQGDSAGDDGDHEEMIDLWEMWFPRDKMLMVFAADRAGQLLEEPLGVWDYDGPRSGPYLLLRFGELPDNVLPAPPLLHMADMHEAMNAIYRKLIQTAASFKELLLVPGGLDEDAKKILDAPHLAAVSVNGLPPEARSWGNISQPSLAMFTDLNRNASRYAGNLDALAGLGPQADTLGQDQMLSAAAGKQIQGMQEQTVRFSQKVMESLCEYWVTDPYRTYGVEVPIKGAPGETVQALVTPQDRAAAHLHLNFQVNPYSLQSEGPAAQLNAMNQMLLQVLLPAMPYMQQQGIVINWNGYVRTASQLSNMRFLDELLTFQEPSPDQELQDVPRMPSATSRTNVRVNRSGGTQAGQDAAQIQTLMGGANQQQKAMEPAQ